MNTIIEKAFDVVMKMAKKIPKGLMYLLIFTLLFPIQSKYIIDGSLSLLFSSLPSSIQVFLDNISTEYVINFFATTLILLCISIIWEIVFKVDRGMKRIDLDANILFELNSIGLICFIIFNKISEKPITTETITASINFSFFYLVAVLFSLHVFLLFFSMTYLFFLWIPFKKIFKIPNLAILLGSLILYIMFLCFLTKYVSREITYDTLSNMNLFVCKLFS